jgi:hypothetical protein
VRLCRRYRKLTARGKEKNIAVVAVARELRGGLVCSDRIPDFLSGTAGAIRLPI